MRVGWRNRDGIGDYLDPQLDRLATQISGLQQRLDAVIARRTEPIADRASQHVASIVAAAEQSAAEIKAAAENDAAMIRERLAGDAQAEADRVRSEAQADAVRIRKDAHAQGERARDKAISRASAEIESVCERLADELRASARSAIAGIAGGARSSSETSTADSSPRVPQEQITDEVGQAVDELRNAATVLEQSLRPVPTAGGEQQPTS